MIGTVGILRLDGRACLWQTQPRIYAPGGTEVQSPPRPSHPSLKRKFGGAVADKRKPALDGRGFNDEPRGQDLPAAASFGLGNFLLLAFAVSPPAGHLPLLSGQPAADLAAQAVLFLSAQADLSLAQQASPAKAPAMNAEIVRVRMVFFILFDSVFVLVIRPAGWMAVQNLMTCGWPGSIRRHHTRIKRICRVLEIPRQVHLESLEPRSRLVSRSSIQFRACLFACRSCGQPGSTVAGRLQRLTRRRCALASAAVVHE